MVAKNTADRSPNTENIYKACAHHNDGGVNRDMWFLTCAWRFREGCVLPGSSLTFLSQNVKRIWAAVISTGTVIAFVYGRIGNKHYKKWQKWTYIEIILVPGKIIMSIGYWLHIIWRHHIPNRQRNQMQGQPSVHHNEGRCQIPAHDMSFLRQRTKSFWDCQ